MEAMLYLRPGFHSFFIILIVSFNNALSLCSKFFTLALPYLGQTESKSAFNIFSDACTAKTYPGSIKPNKKQARAPQ